MQCSLLLSHMLGRSTFRKRNTTTNKDITRLLCGSGHLQDSRAVRAGVVLGEFAHALGRVHRPGRGEDQPEHVGLAHRGEQAQRASDVGVPVEVGPLDGFTCGDKPGEARFLLGLVVS